MARSANGSRGRWVALVILCTASLMIILDGTIVTVALPTIQADLGFTPDSLSWVLDSYLIAFGGLLLLSGRLGDLLGRKRMFLSGIVVFVLASMACGLATGPAMLVTARFVQGTGAAMTSAVTLGMIVRLFGKPAEQGRAIGAFAFTGAVGASAGLIAGGLLVQYASWHWIFFVNLPVGLLTAIAGWRVLAADQGIGLRAGADGLGALLATAGVMLGVLAIVQRHEWWTGLVAVALLAGFVARQATAKTPLLPLRVFTSRNVSGANLSQLLIIGAAMGFQVIVILYMQRALGFSPAAAGLGLVPTAAAIAVVSLGLSARLTSRWGSLPLLIAGLVMITLALALLTRIPARAAYATDLLPPLALFGVGGGLTLPAVTALGMSGATDADAGVISGLFNTAQQVGGALGLAAATTLAAARTGSSHTPQALTSGYHLAWAADAALGVASIVVAAVALRQRRQPEPPVNYCAQPSARTARDAVPESAGLAADGAVRREAGPLASLRTDTMCRVSSSGTPAVGTSASGSELIAEPDGVVWTSWKPVRVPRIRASTRSVMPHALNSSAARRPVPRASLRATSGSEMPAMMSPRPAGMANSAGR
jgi:EmrB/QacA subfamily drug resistance transporter